MQFSSHSDISSYLQHNLDPIISLGKKLTHNCLTLLRNINEYLIFDWGWQRLLLRLSTSDTGVRVGLQVPILQLAWQLGYLAGSSRLLGTVYSSQEPSHLHGWRRDCASQSGLQSWMHCITMAAHLVYNFSMFMFYFYFSIFKFQLLILFGWPSLSPVNSWNSQCTPEPYPYDSDHTRTPSPIPFPSTCLTTCPMPVPITANLGTPTSNTNCQC